MNNLLHRAILNMLQHALLGKNNYKLIVETKIVVPEVRIRCQFVIGDLLAEQNREILIAILHMELIFRPTLGKWNVKCM